MTTICWEEDPNRRPTVDHVLGVLRSAAEKCESRHREPVTLSPRDNPLQPPVAKAPILTPPSVSTSSTANNVAFRSTLAIPREENTKRGTVQAHTDGRDLRSTREKGVKGVR